MKLTTRGRYAVMALLELAAYDANTPLTLAVIAERQNLSLSYLELLFGKLRRCGLVKSVRGPGGGYVLAKSADDISIAQIVAVVDQSRPAKLSGIMLNDDMSGFDGFLEHYLWDELNEKMLEYLQNITLAHLLDKHAHMTRVQSLKRATPILSVMRLAS